MSSRSDRHIARLCNTYFIDTVKVVGDLFQGDLVTGLVFLAIVEEGVAQATAGTESSAVCNPVTVYTVAKRLGFTYETARRHVNRLIKNGYCRRQDGGLVVPRQVLTKPDLVRGGKKNRTHFERLIDDARRARLIGRGEAASAA